MAGGKKEVYSNLRNIKSTAGTSITFLLSTITVPFSSPLEVTACLNCVHVIHLVGTKQEWNTIATDFLKNSRTGTQCATHWKMVLKPSLLKRVWSPEEDGIICNSVARGVTDWNEVAALLPKRKAKHCRERWNNHLDPTLSKAEWTVAEEATLLSAVESHGTNWSRIARILPGRSEPAIQQHWNVLVFRNVASAEGVRRGRNRADPTGGGNSGTSYGNRGKQKPSALPAELLPQAPRNVPDGGVQGSSRSGEFRRGAGRVGTGAFLAADPAAGPAATLTEREKVLMDHAFKTGLTAAAGGGVGVVPPEVIDAIAKGDGMEQLTLTATEDDVFAPLSAALLKDGGDASCSPDMPPPSPTASPLLKPQKKASDCGFLGNDLAAEGWGPEEDPALVDLYRSLDNIGESLFNEDNFELTFDFDSVDKPSAATKASKCAPARSPSTAAHQPSCGGGGGGGSGPPPSWDNLVPGGGGQGQKDISPFRRAAAQAAATMEKQRLSPNKPGQQGRRREDLQVACERAAAAAAAVTAQGGANAGTAKAPATAPPAPLTDPGPRVKQGLLRRLLSGVDSKLERPPSSSQSSFATVRGCLSEANAPPPPVSAASVVGGAWAHGGENRSPRPGPPLSSALFADPSSSAFSRGVGGRDVTGGDDAVVTPTLKHGKAEVQVPRPVASHPFVSSTAWVGAGLGPLSILPPSRFNSIDQAAGDYRWAADEQAEQV